MTSKLYELRRNLKIKIYHQRRMVGERSKCPICGKEITIEGGADIHEVFFTRGDVQGIKDEALNHSIFHPCNVALVHNGECHLKAQHTPEGKRKCAEQIIVYEGTITIQRYFEQIRHILKNSSTVYQEMDLVMTANAMMPKPADQKEPRWQF